MREERTIVERADPFARVEAPSSSGGAAWRMQDAPRGQGSSRMHDPSRAEDSASAQASLVETVGRLAAESAHELNNQISVILNYTFILLRQLPDDSPLREHVPEMQAAAWRASAVAQELLAFGGPREMEPERIDLCAVISNVRTLIGQALQNTSACVVRSDVDVPTVRARQPHLEWLLVELALHARRTLGQVAHFTLELHRETVGDADSVVLQVQATAATPSAAGEPITAQQGSFIPRAFPEDAAHLPGAELTLAHTRGTLSTTRTEGGVAYRLCLPAAS